MYVINLNDKNSKGKYSVSLFLNKNAAVYFNSFGIEYISQEVLNKIKDTWITPNLFSGFYCIAFIEYMLSRKTLLDCINLFSLNNYKKSDIIIYKYFKDNYDRRCKSRV